MNEPEQRPAPPDGYDENPEWTDRDVERARRGPPWAWDRDRTRRALDRILEAIEAQDLDTARDLARRARADLD